MQTSRVAAGRRGSLPDAAAGPVGSRGLQEAPQEQPRSGHCQLKAERIQNAVLHAQDLLPGVCVVRDVAELIHLATARMHAHFLVFHLWSMLVEVLTGQMTDMLSS